MTAPTGSYLVNYNSTGGVVWASYFDGISRSHAHMHTHIHSLCFVGLLDIGGIWINGSGYVFGVGAFRGKAQFGRYFDMTSNFDSFYLFIMTNIGTLLLSLWLSNSQNNSST